jgi:hypothetical protein
LFFLVLTVVPWVLVTRVLPNDLWLKVDGALMSYQSFFENGSIPQKTEIPNVLTHSLGSPAKDEAFLEPHTHRGRSQEDKSLLKFCNRKPN